MSDVTIESAEPESAPEEEGVAAPDESPDFMGESDSEEVFQTEHLSDAGAETVLAVGRDALRGVSDGLRRAMGAGVRTVLSADEKFKDALPAELATYVARQTEAAKGEIVRVIGRQTRSFLEQLDLQSELRRLLSDMTIEVTTTVRVVPGDGTGEAEGTRVVFTDVGEQGSLDEGRLAPLADAVLRALVREWTTVPEPPVSSEESPDPGGEDEEL